MSVKHLQIRRMRPVEIQIAIDWAQREGWNPGLHDARLFYEADPNGFFIGELAEFGDQPVAVGSAVVYDSEFAFCGLYIVAPEHRDKGYGLALTKARLAYCGDRNVGIDGVLENVEIYEEIGYKPFYQNARHQFVASASDVRNPNIVPIQRSHLGAIHAYDRQCFPAERVAFLEHWIFQPGALSLVWLESGQVRGFVVRRQCHEGHKIAPLFADDLEVADGLLSACGQGVDGEPLILDVPDINPDGERLIQRHSMEKTFATARMYQESLPDLAYAKIFGVTSLELG